MNDRRPQANGASPNSATDRPLPPDVRLDAVEEKSAPAKSATTFYGYLVSGTETEAAALLDRYLGGSGSAGRSPAAWVRVGEEAAQD